MGPFHVSAILVTWRITEKSFFLKKIKKNVWHSVYNYMAREEKTQQKPFFFLEKTIRYCNDFDKKSVEAFVTSSL